MTGKTSQQIDITEKMNKKNIYRVDYHKYKHTGVYLIAKRN